MLVFVLVVLKLHKHPHCFSTSCDISRSHRWFRDMYNPYYGSNNREDRRCEKKMSQDALVMLWVLNQPKLAWFDVNKHAGLSWPFQRANTTANMKDCNRIVKQRARPQSTWSLSLSRLQLPGPRIRPPEAAVILTVVCPRQPIQQTSHKAEHMSCGAFVNEISN